MANKLVEELLNDDLSLDKIINNKAQVNLNCIVDAKEFEIDLLIDKNLSFNSQAVISKENEIIKAGLDTESRYYILTLAEQPGQMFETYYLDRTNLNIMIKTVIIGLDESKSDGRCKIIKNRKNKI